VLYQGDAVILGETRFDAVDDTFRREAVADVWPSIAFPRVPLGIHAADSSPVFGDANTAVLFTVGRPYRRISIDGRGSWTEWIEIRPDVLAEMLAHRRARRLLADDGVADALALEETALAIAGEVLAAGSALPAAFKPKSRDVVFDVQAILNRQLGRAVSLAEISDAVDVSPYHLCRLFRHHTGLPIHRYRNALRLHASLDRLMERDTTALDIALDLGFSSEAHFSDAFQKAFGVRPGAFRKSVSGGSPRRPRPRTR